MICFYIRVYIYNMYLHYTTTKPIKEHFLISFAMKILYFIHSEGYLYVQTLYVKYLYVQTFYVWTFVV